MTPVADSTAERRAAFLALSERLGLSKPRTAALCRVHESAVGHWRSGRRAVPGYALALLEAEAERREVGR